MKTLTMMLDEAMNEIKQNEELNEAINPILDKLRKKGSKLVYHKVAGFSEPGVMAQNIVKDFCSKFKSLILDKYKTDITHNLNPKPKQFL